MKQYIYTHKHNGIIRNIYAEKFPNGMINGKTKEARIVLDKKFIEWYNKNHK